MTSVGPTQCDRCGRVRLRALPRTPTCPCGGALVALDAGEAVRRTLASLDDEYAAAELLHHLRYPGGWGCDACGHPRCTHLRTRPRQFACNGCGAVTSVTAGTSLHRCRLPLVVVVRAAVLLVRPGRSVSARALARELGVTLETAWSLAHRLRAGFLAAPPVPLGREVVLSRMGFRWRPHGGEQPRQQRVLARFTAVWDSDGRVGVVTGESERHADRRLLDAHADVARTLVVPFRFWQDPWCAGRHTHRGVSERWLAFYVHAMAGWHNEALAGGCAATRTLRATLACARHPFARLRPHPPPADRLGWSASWEEWNAHAARWSRERSDEPPGPPAPTVAAASGP